MQKPNISTLTNNDPTLTWLPPKNIHHTLCDFLGNSFQLPHRRWILLKYAKTLGSLSTTKYRPENPKQETSLSGIGKLFSEQKKVTFGNPFYDP